MCSLKFGAIILLKIKIGHFWGENLKNAVQFATCARRPSGLRGSVGYCMPTPFVSHAVRRAGCGNVLKMATIIVMKYQIVIARRPPACENSSPFVPFYRAMQSYGLQNVLAEIRRYQFVKIKIGHFG